MNIFRVGIQLMAVAAVATSMALLGLVAGLTRADAPAEVAASVVASPEARADIADGLVEDLRATTPVASAIPGLDSLVRDAIASPLVDDLLAQSIERDVRARLGEAVGPVVIKPADLISTTNPLVQQGVDALPAIAIQTETEATAATLVAVERAGLIVLVSTAALLVGAGLLVGRARCAQLAGLGGLLGCGLLFALPVLAFTFGGALAGVLVSAIVVPTMVAVAAGLSALVLIRATLADTGAVPYRSINWLNEVDAGPVDLGFEF